MPYQIEKNKCVSCGACAGVCPVAAIAAADGKYQIDPSKCINCGTCISLCPMSAIAVSATVAMDPKVVPMPKVNVCTCDECSADVDDDEIMDRTAA